MRRIKGYKEEDKGIYDGEKMDIWRKIKGYKEENKGMFGSENKGIYGGE